MGNWSEWLPFLSDTIDKVPEKSGVYELHTVNELLYIGQSGNIRQRLKQHLGSDDRCIKKATVFHYYETPYPNSTEEELLKAYKKNHGGKLPACNELSS